MLGFTLWVKPNIQGYSGQYTACDISPTNCGRSGWPNNWRMAWASPVWNQ
jgi:hypothetical protein